MSTNDGETFMADLDAPPCERGYGQTALQIMEAPQGAVFIFVRGATIYPRELAVLLNRADLSIVGPSWIAEEKWRGLTLTGIVVDHAVELTRGEEIALMQAQAAIRQPVFVATHGVSQAAQQFFGDPF
jgi:hypothetical protein